MDAYKARELARNIEFITSEHRHLLKFKLPEHLYIYIINSDEKALLTKKEYKWGFDKISEFDGEFKLGKETQGMWFFNHLLRALYFNILRSDLEFSTLQVNIEHVKSAKGSNFHEFILSVLENMKKGKVEGYSADYLVQKANVVIKFIDFVFESVVKRYDNLTVHDEAIFRIPLDENEKFNAKEFIDLYVQAKNITDFINFKLRSLSSGEQSILTMVSRFYKLSDGRDHNELKKNLIILMDEGDLYFHPEWQRVFMNDLLEYLPKIFGDRKMQFILAANTPYLASDLPKSNVIFLKKTKDDTIVLNPENDRENTFAANIHTLLSDSFFVSNFVGEFAANKIEKLLEYLVNPQDSDLFTPEMAKKHINIIGEPLIRNRLLDIYYDQFPHEEKSIFDRHKELQEELKELEEQIEEEKGKKPSRND